MNNNSSMSSIDDPMVEKTNNIRDQLLTKSWDEIKANKDVTSQALSNSASVNAGLMIDMERVNLLAKLFNNFELIQQKDMNQVLKAISESTENGIAQVTLNTIVPGLQIKEGINWVAFKEEANLLLNGYNNLRNIALSMIAEDLYIDIQPLKRLTPEQISSTTEEVNVLAQQIIISLNKSGDLSKEQFDEICNLLKLTGRTNFEIVSIINNKDKFIIVDLFTRVKKALEIVHYAQTQQSADKLDNLDYIAEVLIAINSK